MLTSQQQQTVQVTEFMTELRRLTISRSGPKQPRVKASLLELRQAKTTT